MPTLKHCLATFNIQKGTVASKLFQIQCNVLLMKMMILKYVMAERENKTTKFPLKGTDVICRGMAVVSIELILVTNFLYYVQTVYAS